MSLSVHKPLFMGVIGCKPVCLRVGSLSGTNVILQACTELLKTSTFVAGDGGYHMLVVMWKASENVDMFV